MNDGGLLDTVLNNFTSAISGSWGPTLSAYLLPLLLSLVCLQFGMIAIEAAIARDIPLLLMHVMLGILRVGIVIAIFQNAFTWGNDVVSTFQQIAEDVSGLTPATGPSEVFDNGGAIAQAIASAKASGSWYSEIVQNIKFFIAELAVLACWTFASLIYLECLIEVALIVYGGPLIIAITPLTWTFDLLILWARTLLSIGFKIALVLMTLGIGTVLAKQWVATAGADTTTFTTDIWNLFLCIIESVIFAYCVWKVPNRLSGLAPGAAILGFGQAVASAGAGAVGGALQQAAHGGGGGGSGSSASGGGSSGGGGHGGITSEGWGAQAAHATADAAKALAKKVQARLTT